jgi:hypothetical protein
LENLAIRLKESGPDWFGPLQRSADRPLKGITFYRALDSREEAELPLGTGATRLLREPYI